MLKRYFLLGYAFCAMLGTASATQTVDLLADTGELKVNHLPNGGKGSRVNQKYYTVSYNLQHKNPEWVAYELTDIQRIQADVNNLPRDASFRNNPALANTASDKDYTNSGYDRGHLVPAEDMSFEQAAMTESFLITNVSPQNPSFNRGIWKSLEDKVRDWAMSEHKIYVVAGGVLSNGLPTIGKGVSVPQKFFKVVLVYEAGNKKAIGFVFDNAKATKPLKEYAVSVDEVEKLTGFDFFPNLNDKEEKLLESNFNASDWGF